MVIQTEMQNGVASKHAWSQFTDECKDTAIVMPIRVEVEQILAHRIGKGVQHDPVRPLADIDNALKHGFCLSDDGPKCYGQDMFSFLEGPELIVLIVVVLVLFGGSQLPKLAKNLGQAQKEFKKAMDNKSDDSSDGSPTDK